MPGTTPPPVSPLDRLLRVYDAAIAACRAQNARDAYTQLGTLRAAHPCDTPSALGIDALYAWCEQAVRSGDYLGAVRTLEGLRGAWQAADRLVGPGDDRRRDLTRRDLSRRDLMRRDETRQFDQHARSPRSVRP